MKWEGWQVTGAALIIGATLTGLYRWLWKHIKGKWWA